MQTGAANIGAELKLERLPSNPHDVRIEVKCDQMITRSHQDSNVT